MKTRAVRRSESREYFSLSRCLRQAKYAPRRVIPMAGSTVDLSMYTRMVHVRRFLCARALILPEKFKFGPSLTSRITTGRWIGLGLKKRQSTGGLQRGEVNSPLLQRLEIGHDLPELLVREL